MTNEEIQKAIREYALKQGTALCPASCIDYVINDFIEQLSKDYCIMPKSKVRENYQSLKQDIPNFKDNPEHHCGFLGGMTELELLFGKSFFEEEK